MIDNDLMIGENYHTLSIDRLFKSNEKKKHDFIIKTIWIR